MVIFYYLLGKDMSLDEMMINEFITKGRQALELFTDRQDAIRHFLNYINEEPPTEKISCFMVKEDMGNLSFLTISRINTAKG